MKERDTNLHALKIAYPPNQSSLSWLISRSPFGRLTVSSGSSGWHRNFDHDTLRLLIIWKICCYLQLRIVRVYKRR